MSEIWKPIKGYEELYEASNLGNIRSLPRGTAKGRLIKQHVSKKNGYCYVSLCKNNKATTKRVHKLVYSAFYGWEWGDKYDKNHTIDHIDGDKTNNALANLEMCTQSENQKRAFRNGLNPVRTRKVIDLTTGEIFDSVVDACVSMGGGRNGTAIIRVCKGQRSQYRNHRFAYYEDFIRGTAPAFSGRPRRSSETLWVR